MMGHGGVIIAYGHHGGPWWAMERHDELEASIWEWGAIVGHRAPWGTRISRMVHHGTPWCAMVHHGGSQCALVLYNEIIIPTFGSAMDDHIKQAWRSCSTIIQGGGINDRNMFPFGNKHAEGGIDDRNMFPFGNKHAGGGIDDKICFRLETNMQGVALTTEICFRLETNMQRVASTTEICFRLETNMQGVASSIDDKICFRSETIIRRLSTNILPVLNACGRKLSAGRERHKIEIRFFI